MARLPRRPDGSTRLSLERDGFYARTLSILLERRYLTTDMRILVAASGSADCAVLQSLGFSNVTVSNIEAPHAEYPQYRHEVQDIEALGYDDCFFDWAIVSHGLHHCRSPHRALLELYRVARCGLFALESRDSALMRAAVRSRVIDAYELTAVAASGFRAGGVRNTAIPNYVYRWTEREIEKTIASHAPHAKHRFMYFHALEFPMSVYEVDARRRRIGAIIGATQPLLRAITRIVPRQANLFAFAVVKPTLPDDLHPWLRLQKGEVVADVDWISRQLGL